MIIQYLTSILVNIKNMQFSMLQFPHEIEIEVFLTRFINSKLFIKVIFACLYRHKYDSETNGTSHLIMFTPMIFPNSLIKIAGAQFSIS